MFTQSRDPEKTKPAIKKCCSCCHKTIPSISACFEKQRDDEDERRAHVRSKFPQKSFVQYFRSPSNDRTKIMIHDNEVTITITNDTNSQNIYWSISRDCFSYDKSTTLYNILEQELIIRKETRDLIALPIDPHSNHLIDVTLATDIDLVQILVLETTVLHAIHSPLHHIRDKEFLDFLDLVHIQKQETDLITFNHQRQMMQLTLKYICIKHLM